MMRTIKFQVGLLQCLLLMAMIAVWLGVYRLRADTERMRVELKSIEAYHPVLIVDNPQEIQVLEEPMVWQHEVAWQVYIPPDRSLELWAQPVPELHLSDEARALGDGNLSKLSSGMHRIAFRYELASTWNAGTTSFAVMCLKVDDRQYILHRRPLTGDDRPQYALPRRPEVDRKWTSEGDIWLSMPEKSQDIPWRIWLAEGASN